MIYRASGHGPALGDLHVHSRCSSDGVSSIATYARRAHELGLAEVGFCEHVDLDPRDDGYLYLDPARYARELAAARAMLPGLALRQGVEITYLAGLEDQAREWLARGAWDYVVVSVHALDRPDGWALISEHQAAERYFMAHAPRQAYQPYFEELLRAAQSGLGQVLGHLDLVKRYGTAHYGPFEPAAFEDEIRAVLGAAVAAGIAVEINTSGLRQPPAEPYPGLTILRWYREQDGELLTVGSDAHHVDDLAAGLEDALHLARAAGFRALTTFEQGRAGWLAL